MNASAKRTVIPKSGLHMESYLCGCILMDLEGGVACNIAGDAIKTGITYLFFKYINII